MSEPSMPFVFESACQAFSSGKRTQTFPATCDRRAFFTKTLGAAGFLAVAGGLTATGCIAKSSEAYPSSGDAGVSAPIPAASPDPESPFDVDTAITMETIDEYVGRSDVAFRDMRLIKDPASYEDIGGNSELSITIEGFKIVPFPYIGTLQQLPVDGAYDGECLFDIEWSEDGQVMSATPRYKESIQIVEELFPRDIPLLLMCGGAGYAGMMRRLLIYLGWDPNLVHNIGAAWDYAGYKAVELISYDADGSPSYCLWRADMAPVEFATLTPLL